MSTTDVANMLIQHNDIMAHLVKLVGVLVFVGILAVLGAAWLIIRKVDDLRADLRAGRREA